jgi:hypothetical protein
MLLRRILVFGDHLVLTDDAVEGAVMVAGAVASWAYERAASVGSGRQRSPGDMAVT